MASKLASSVFTRTPDETTVVADVYKELAPGVVTSFQDSESSSFDLASQFGFLSKASSAAGMLASSAGNALKDATGKIGDALGDSMGKAKSLLGDLASGKASVVATIQGTTNGVTGLLRQASSVQYQINGITRAIQNGNLSDIRSITNTLNAVVGTSSMLLQPNGAVAGIYSSLVGEAGKAGISDAFGMIAGSIQASTSFVNKGQMIYQIASGSLPGAVQRGDLRSVASMVDYIGNGTVGMMNPAAVRQLSRNNQDAYTQQQIGGSQGQFIQYQGAYQKIDPAWNQSSWRPQGTSTPIRDLSTLMDASRQTKQVFSTGAKLSANPADKYFAILDKFGGSKSVNQEITSRYPMAVTPSSGNMCVRDTSPRVEYATVR